MVAVDAAVAVSRPSGRVRHVQLAVLQTALEVHVASGSGGGGGAELVVWRGLQRTTVVLTGGVAAVAGATTVALHEDPAATEAAAVWHAETTELEAAGLLGRSATTTTTSGGGGAAAAAVAHGEEATVHLVALAAAVLPANATAEAHAAAQERTRALAARADAGDPWRAVADALQLSRLGNRAAEPEAVVDVQGDQRWPMLHQMHNELLAAAAAAATAGTAPRGLFVGDSIIQQMALSAWWADKVAPLRVLNFGVGGDQTQHVLWRMRNLGVDAGEAAAAGRLALAQTCMSVVVLVGTNNHDHTAAQIAGGVLAVARALRELCPLATVTLLGLLPRGRYPNSVRAKGAQVNQLLEHTLRTWADAHIELLNVGGAFVEADGTISHTVMWDFLHLTPSTYAALGAHLAPALARMV